MDLMSGNYFHDIFQGLHGPGKFRFFIQPLIAILLGLRDGKMDFSTGGPPYFIHLFLEPHNSTMLMRNGAAHIIKPFLLAWLMDTLFQIMILGRWNPFQAVVVGLLLVAFPYIISRGLYNRLLRRIRAET